MDSFILEFFYKASFLTQCFFDGLRENRVLKYIFTLNVGP